MAGRFTRIELPLLALLALALLGAGFAATAEADSIVAAPVSLSTRPSQPSGDPNCTVTLGFWKNHPESWTRVTSMSLGTVTYSQSQLLAILRQSPSGNGLVTLAHQLITAKLNLLLGAVPPAEVSEAIAEADALIGSLVVPPVGTGRLSTLQISALENVLASFNVGQIGPGHCPDSLEIVPTQRSTWGQLKLIYR